MRTRSSLLFLLTTTLSFSSSIGGDTLTPSRPLSDADGATLISAGGRFELGFFSPAATTGKRYVGIWYRNIPVQNVVWVANRKGPVIGGNGRLSLALNGTLIITDGNENSTVIWSSAATALANPAARLLDSGNFVVSEAGRDGINSYAWQSFDIPTDTIIPGMKLGWNLSTGLNRNITAWTNSSDPTPSGYTFGIDLHGDPQFFTWYGTQQFWRAGPWTGLYLTGLPEYWAAAHNLVAIGFVMDAHQVTYTHSVGDPNVTWKLIIDPSGATGSQVWIEEQNFWVEQGILPKDVCDRPISRCGRNGVCRPDLSPMCDCLPGFQPSNPRAWLLWDVSDGCVRKTALDCNNGTDGFNKQSSVKLPDTSNSTVDWSTSMSLEQCRELCLKNCSCTAYASANISTGSGSGCIIWTTDLADIKFYSSGKGQDIYVRVAAADLVVEPSRSRSGLVVTFIAVPAVAAALLASAACFIWMRKKRNRRNDKETVGEDLNLPLFDLAAILEATGNFSEDNKLGEGGFGPVYKGKTREGQEIAVKRLSKTSEQGMDEFKNEVNLIAKLQHRNLVRLLGCCIQREERMLIYEYMPSGSLDAFLFGTARRAMEWGTRYKIIVGIARGLLYLHQDSRLRIIHRDLKASNILLDKDMIPKISDFGTAKIQKGDDIIEKTKKVIGTYGYMSPEYVMHGNFSVKSDVFSFGVLMLEIISGKKNNGASHFPEHLNLLDHMWSLWRKGKASGSIDKSLGDAFLRTPEILRCINIGLLCVQERPIDRPTMSSVVSMLNSDTAQLPEPTQPGFVASRDTSEADSLCKSEMLSRNNVTITVLEGR